MSYRGRHSGCCVHYNVRRTQTPCSCECVASGKLESGPFETDKLFLLALIYLAINLMYCSFSACPFHHGTYLQVLSTMGIYATPVAILVLSKI
jgi:hypothetical protein